MCTTRFVRGLLVAGALLVATLVTGAPAQASFPGKNGKIVFVANTSGSWQLYTINPDGSEVFQVTYLDATPFDLWAPSFSPDGKRIVFGYGPGIHGSGAPTNLYVINADSTGLTQLTNDGLSFWPHWSPDGTRIVFLQLLATGAQVVVTMRADGTGEKTVLTSDFWNASARPSGWRGVEYDPRSLRFLFLEFPRSNTGARFSMAGRGDARLGHLRRTRQRGLLCERARAGSRRVFH